MTKRTLTFTALTIGAVFSYFSIACVISGFIIAKFAGGKREGMPGIIRSIVIPMKGFKFHLHHWLFFPLFMLVGLAENIFLYISPEVFYGLLAGAAWQGIYCYDDWHRVIYRSN
jgi:hypothetical protein